MLSQYYLSILNNCLGIIALKCCNYYHLLSDCSSMTISYNNLLTREGTVMANGWTRPSSTTIFVRLFIRSVIRKVTKYHTTLNIIFSSAVVCGSWFASVLKLKTSPMACKSPSRHCVWCSVFSFPSEVVSSNYLNSQLRSGCCLHCRIHLVHFKWEFTTEASQRTQILLSSLDLCVCSWAEGSDCETSLLTCCAKLWTRSVAVQLLVRFTQSVAEAKSILINLMWQLQLWTLYVYVEEWVGLWDRIVAIEYLQRWHSAIAMLLYHRFVGRNVVNYCPFSFPISNPVLMSLIWMLITVVKIRCWVSTSRAL